MAREPTDWWIGPLVFLFAILIITIVIFLIPPVIYIVANTLGKAVYVWYAYWGFK